MFLYLGPKMYGRVQVADGAYVETEFFCANFLPLWFTRSRLCVARGAEPQLVPLRPYRRSVLVGYLRPWSILGGVALFFAHAPLAAVALCFALAALTWAAVRTPADARARAAVYEAVAGLPVDPALLDDDARAALRDRLRAELATRAPSLARATYRDAPAAAWEDVAADPVVTDADFLRAAMTLARAEAPSAPLDQRLRLRRAHDAAWGKIRR